MHFFLFAGTGHKGGNGGGEDIRAATLEKLVRLEESDTLLLELVVLRATRDDLGVARRELEEQQRRCSEALGQVASLRAELREARAQAQQIDLSRAGESSKA